MSSPSCSREKSASPWARRPTSSLAGTPRRLPRRFRTVGRTPGPTRPASSWSPPVDIQHLPFNKVIRLLAERTPVIAQREETTAAASVAAEAARRRTFAITSHPDAGKTTLTEKLLLYAGAVELAGSVRA